MQKEIVMPEFEICNKTIRIIQLGYYGYLCYDIVFHSLIPYEETLLSYMYSHRQTKTTKSL